MPIFMPFSKGQQFSCLSNVTEKETEKIEKYRDASIEPSSLWKMKCEVIPMINGDWDV